MYIKFLYVVFFPLKFIIDVVPNKPALLKPQTCPNTPAVFNAQEVDSRTLVKNLTLIVTVINWIWFKMELYTCIQTYIHIYIIYTHIHTNRRDLYQIQKNTKSNQGSLLRFTFEVFLNQLESSWNLHDHCDILRSFL